MTIFSNKEISLQEGNFVSIRKFHFNKEIFNSHQASFPALKSGSGIFTCSSVLLIIFPTFREVLAGGGRIYVFHSYNRHKQALSGTVQVWTDFHHAGIFFSVQCEFFCCSTVGVAQLTICSFNRRLAQAQQASICWRMIFNLDAE